VLLDTIAATIMGRWTAADLFGSSFGNVLLVFPLRTTFPRLEGVLPLSFVRDHASHQRGNKTDDLVAIPWPNQLFIRLRHSICTKRTSGFHSILLSWLLNVLAEELLARPFIQEILHTLKQAQLHHVRVSLPAVANTILPLRMCRIEHIYLRLSLKLKKVLGAQLERHEEL
jgi:hypothetical protein